VADILSRLLDLAVELQQIPSPTFHEGPRAAFMRRRFEAEGLSGVEIDATGNVYACLKADEGRRTKDQRHPLVVTAHLDTVFPPGVDLTIRRAEGRLSGPGIGDNCAGLAGLFGLVWALRAGGIFLPGDVWLVGNTCEEGLGNLRGMKAVVERFGAGVQAYLVLEGMALGQVYHRGLGVRRYRIRARTAGGHSWIDYGKPSAVHELTRLSSELTRVAVPGAPRSSLNIGVIAGGTSVNTIAAEAALELDLRSESPEALEALAGQVERICESANRPGVEVSAEGIGTRPAGGIPAEAPLVRLAEQALRSLGETPRRNIGSTDANLPLSRGLPAVAIGLTTGGGAHTVHEYINTAPLARGLDQVVRLAQGVWGI
jgi:acetylornithine deacetylase/succinyl-diaminopimelate desuccinylase-like protein